MFCKWFCSWSCVQSLLSAPPVGMFFGASVQRNLPGLQPAPPQLHQEVAALRRIHTWTRFIAHVLCHYCSYSHVTTVVKIKIYLLMYQIVDKNHKFSSSFLFKNMQLLLHFPKLHDIFFNFCSMPEQLK